MPELKIIVAITVAGSLDESARLLDGEVDPSAIDWELNEWDRFALEAALQLRDDHGGEVLVVSAGEDEVQDGLLTALAMGADRAIQIGLDGSRLDPISVARVLAAAIAPEAPDLVLTGTQTSDGGTGATGTALAALLGLPRVAVVRSIELSDGELTVRRELEGGLLELVKLSLPALLTIQTGINEPRYATLRQIRQAAAKPRVEQSLADLGLDPGTLVAGSARQLALSLPRAREGAAILEGDACAIASHIASMIRSKVGS